ncbi:F-box protein At3g07870-like [Salvia hispanica]|uniref:F-box protein At3g07870-like n=1 Tax=Salvia hispanica TaxID=49212 RepID=UPI002009D749|nr:F-box protein At3g07870-like [Salvia hispanica]
MKTVDNSKMGEDFFKYLPSEIVVDILLRLPTRAAMACKCVCKPWLGLLATPEFVNSHTSRSVLGIAFETRSMSYKTIEFVDELGLDLDEEHRWDVTFSFRLPFDGPFRSSVNGVIFIRDFDHGDLILCNPITRDYIKLPRPRLTPPKVQDELDNFGFGVSRMTRQYKVVWILSSVGHSENPPPGANSRNACQVYTVGTGSWRNVPFGMQLRFIGDNGGVFFNENLHWTVAKTRKGSNRWIACFNLETELFSTFSAPRPHGRGFLFSRSLCVLRDCLCVSDISKDGCVIIWLMKEDDRSWTKIFVIPESDRLPDNSGAERLTGAVHIWPIRIFENGDALMEWEDGMIFYYSNKRKNLDYNIMSLGDRDPFTCTIMYASSFVSLKSFVMENVCSF